MLYSLVNTDQWTFGAEHELADWSGILPPGFARSPDHTIVNTNGVAAQPNLKVYAFGGEINTPPTKTMEEQVECLKTIISLFPEAKVNHRSNLHIHIRVPTLKDSLHHLKQVQTYIHQLKGTGILSAIEPIPPGTTAAESKRARRRKVSHQTFLTEARLQHQLRATTVKEFFEREVPQSKTGKVMWHAQPRCCVNLRQLLQTDTVEFRHFPGTLSLNHFHNCLLWCCSFLKAALTNTPLKELWSDFRQRRFPQFPDFDEEREIHYQATAARSGLKEDQIVKNIQQILKGQFNAEGSPKEYEAARQRAGCLPRGSV